MRIARLDLLAYGHFTDRSIEFPGGGPDLHIIVGRNEAGKSTARTAISDLLYGFSHKTRFAFLHDERNLRVGALVEGAGSSLVVRRRKGRKDTLLDEAGSVLPEADLQAMMGAGDRSFFDRMFSLDEAELREGGRAIVENKDDASATIFSASAGLADLNAEFDRLQSEADEQWSLRKSQKRAYYQAQELLDEATRSLRDHAVRATDIKARRADREAADHAVHDLREQITELAAQHQKLLRIRRTSSDLARLDLLEGQRQALGQVISLPAEAGETLSKANEAMARLGTTIRLLDAQLERDAAERDDIRVDEALIAHADEITWLIDALARTASHEGDIPKRENEVALKLRDCLETASRIGLAATDEAGLRAVLPTEFALSRLVELADRQATLQSEREAALKLLKDRQQGAQNIDAELETIATTEIPPRLAAAIESAMGLGAISKRRNEFLEGVRRAEMALEAATDGLSPWTGTPAELDALVVPSASEVEAARSQRAMLQDSLAKIELRLKDTAREIAENKRAEQGIRKGGKAVSPQEIETARSARDTVWSTLREHILAGGDRGFEAKPVVGQMEEAVADADGLADRRFDGVADSTKLMELGRTRALLEGRQEDAETERDDIAAELDHHRLAWLARLSEQGLPQLEPEDLRDWLTSRKTVLKTARDEAREREKLGGFDQTVGTSADELLAALTEAGGTAGEGADLGTLVAAARSFSDATVAATARRSELHKRKRKLAQEVSKIDEEVAAGTAALEAQDAEWATATNQAGLALNASAGAARNAERLVTEIRSDLNAIGEVQRRLSSMHRDLEALEARAKPLLAQVAPELSERSTRSALPELQTRLTAERQKADRRTAAITRISETGVTREKAKADLEFQEDSLHPLLEAARVDDIAGLTEAIALSESAEALDKDIAETNVRLLDAGEGRDIVGLREDKASIDIDSLAPQIDDLESRRAALTENRDLAIKTLAEAQRALDDVSGGDDAARAEGDRQAALADMAEAVQRYIRARLPARLLRWSIDRYRKEKQSPLLERAGQLFGVLTDGSFSGLEVDLDGDVPALFALRNGGGLKTDELSHGTEDQLYLALRLAALEEHLARHPQLPFIADDLFVQFDDQRSAAGLRVLEQLAQSTQVLFFTHHAHLVDLARRELGKDVRVVEI